MIPHSGHALSHLYAEFVRYPTPQTAEYLVVVTAAQVLAALSCDCGGHKREGKEHTPSCRALQWAKERLRNEVSGLRLNFDCVAGGMKAQLKRADRSGARLALILGDDELEADRISVKALREQDPQESLELNELIARLLRDSAS